MGEKKRSTIGRVIRLLSPRDRGHLILVIGLSLVAAVIEVMGVGSIMPFLAVASNPDVIDTNRWLAMAYGLLGFGSHRDFLIALGLAVIGFVIVTSGVRGLTRFTVVRFTSHVRHRISVKLMEGYLRQDYVYFLSRNSHEFAKNINGEVQQMVQGTLVSFIDMIGFSLQLVLFIAFLLVVSPWITLTLILVVGTVYGLIYGLLRTTVKRLGQQRFDMNRERSRIVSETFWGIKDAKLMAVEKVFLDEYKGPSLKLAQTESGSEVISDVPKFALEAAAFSSILMFVLVIVIDTGSFQNAAVTVGLFAYAGYRMIPAMQNLFRTLTKMRFSAPSANRICQEMEELSQTLGPLHQPSQRMPFATAFELADVSFQYPSNQKIVLDHLQLSIPRRQTIGFAGPTGSGKTTLIDIVLGLLEPTEGVLLVDGVEVTVENRRNWQANIGYVPQVIYLSNTSIAQNIAFGVPLEQIDLAKVERAARMAQIHDFIVTGLDKGYQTAVGERGVRLSGGQRQRLGIARALYREPEVLVFDEATSALDNETEAAVMEAVHSLAGQVTVLMIAHRLSTLKECDCIYLLDGGQIRDSGTYEELSLRQKAFQE